MGTSGERGLQGEPGIKVPIWLKFLLCTCMTALLIVVFFTSVTEGIDQSVH